MQASPSPDFDEQQTMKMLVATQPALFNEKQLLFGTKNGMSFFENLDKMKKDLAELRSQQEDDRRRLDQLEPTRIHIKTVRKPVLAKLAHGTNTENWPTDPLSIQARNGFAHGGQVKTDIATIESEGDPAERLLLTKGFEVGYIVPLSVKQEFLRYNAVLNLMNIHCNLSTLDNLISKTNDRKEAFNLLKGWIKWKDRGSDLNTYPFTTDRLSMLGYNRLLRNYGHAIPRE